MPLSGKMRQWIEQLGAVTSAPILILGESGTGKEVVARAIHGAGARRQRPFVPIDCGALVGTLMESELFGHVRGAFTDAKMDKRGLIGEADGGTAFFDEIGDLPYEMQVKLLRVLQEREYRPVGSTRAVKVDMRVIAATWRDLPAAVEAGKFRQDLFYRLNVVSMPIQPLRKRRSEIPALVDYFLQRSGTRNCFFSQEALLKLCNYDWPGNVRELGNVVQRVAALADGPVFTSRDLPEEFNAIRKADSPNGQVMTLADLEKSHILKTLEDSGGDKSGAAYLLGISRSTLFRKLKDYGVE